MDLRVECREYSLPQVRKVKPIASGYETDRIFVLQRQSSGEATTWRLSEERLARPFRKEYDSGLVDEWLESYEGQTSLDELTFLGAMVDGEIKGLATYSLMGWNNTLWLIDVRTGQATRRKGVGSALLREVQRAAREKKARGISVETQTNNYPAICFYRKHGFLVSGFNDHLYTNEDVENQDVAVFLFWEL
jgi:ribosomal protein S18 acetylase RimI-like enzyme